MKAEQHDLQRILTLRDEFKRRGTHCVAVTVARGGSVRLPRKNVQPFCGRPLVGWSVLQGRCSHLVTDNYVSTDDEEIADISRAAGAEIIWRYESAGKGSTANVPFSHAIRQIREHHPVDIILSILPTGPVRQPWDYDESVALYWLEKQKRGRINQLIPLAPKLETVVHREVDDFRSQVILGDKRGRFLDGAGSTWSVCDPDWYLRMAQEGPKTDAEIDEQFVDYSNRVRDMANQPCLYYYRMEPWQCFDIDTLQDWGTQEALMRQHILTTPDVYERYKAKETP